MNNETTRIYVLRKIPRVRRLVNFIKALIIIENIHLEIVIKIFISLFIMCLMITFDNNYLLNVFQIKLVPLYIYVSRDTCDLNNFERFKVTINILDVYGIF